MDLPQIDPHNTIQPPQSVKPRRVSPRSLPEYDLVHNPCVRGGSQADLYDNWIRLSLTQDDTVCFGNFGELCSQP